MLRYTPQPTKDLSVNELRIALINYIISKQKECGFLIRVNDIDKDKTIEGKDQEIVDILKKFAIDTQNGTHQSQNLNIYKQLSLKLLKENRAFICFCKDSEQKTCANNCEHLTQDELKKKIENSQNYSIRIKKPKNEIKFKDTIFGDIALKPEEIGDFVIFKSNKLPTNDFANAIDDMSAGISTIIQDKKHLLSIPRQIHIRQELGFAENIEYAHLPTIIEKDKNSKQYMVKWLLQEGYLPDAIINYLLTLGYKTPKEIFYLPDAIKWLDISKFSKQSEFFDIEKLKEINKEHLKLIDSKKLSKIFGFADSDIGDMLKVYLNEASTIKELDKIIVSIFSPKDCSSNCGENMLKLSKIIKRAPMLDSFDEFKQYLAKKSGLKQEELLKAINLLITGLEKNAKVEDIYRYIKPYLLEVTKCR